MTDSSISVFFLSCIWTGTSQLQGYDKRAYEARQTVEMGGLVRVGHVWIIRIDKILSETVRLCHDLTGTEAAEDAIQDA